MISRIYASIAGVILLFLAFSPVTLGAQNLSELESRFDRFRSDAQSVYRFDEEALQKIWEAYCLNSSVRSRGGRGASFGMPARGRLRKRYTPRSWKFGEASLPRRVPTTASRRGQAPLIAEVAMCGEKPVHQALVDQR
jgi:hypothetical protein